MKNDTKDVILFFAGIMAFLFVAIALDASIRNSITNITVRKF